MYEDINVSLCIISNLYLCSCMDVLVVSGKKRFAMINLSIILLCVSKKTSEYIY